MSELNLFFQIITALGAIATAIAVWYLVKSFQSNQKGLLVSNFSVITDYIGNEITRKNRRILYNSTKQMDELLKTYPNHKEDLQKLNDAAKQISAMYDRVGFLLDQDSDIEGKILEYQGFTLGIMWKMIEPLHNTWKEKDKALDYKQFKRIGEKAYAQYSTEIDQFIQNKKESESS